MTTRTEDADSDRDMHLRCTPHSLQASMHTWIRARHVPDANLQSRCVQCQHDRAVHGACPASVQV